MANATDFILATALSAAERSRHERHMARVLDWAGEAHSPFAASLVHRGEDRLICRGLNRKRHNPILHGEISAILECSRRHPETDWRALTLYTTAEPCPMCKSAIIWTGIPEVVYGASIRDLARLRINQIHLDSPTVAAAAPFYAGRIVGDVLKDRAVALYKTWAEDMVYTNSR